jgi:hypothetical protein
MLIKILIGFALSIAALLYLCWKWIEKHPPFMGG